VAPRWAAYSSSRCSCRHVFVPSTPSLGVFRSTSSHFIRVGVSDFVKKNLLRSPAYTLQQCSAPAESGQGAENTNFACLQTLHSSLAARTRAMQSRDTAQAECESTLSPQGRVRLLLQPGQPAAPRLPLATARRTVTGASSPDAEKAQRSAAAAAAASTGPSSSLANATRPAARTAAHGSGRPARRTGPLASLRRVAAALAHSFGGSGGKGGGAGAAGPSGGGVDSAARERAIAAAADAARHGLHDLGAAFSGIAVAIGGHGDVGCGGRGGGATGAAGGAGGNGQAEAETSAAAPAAVAIGGGESPAESLAFVGALALQVRFFRKNATSK